MDEQELVIRAKKGDRDAWRKLFDSYFLRVYRLALFISKNDDDARDISQQAFTDGCGVMTQNQPIVSLELHRGAGDVITGSVLAQQKCHAGGFDIGYHQFRHFTEFPDFTSIRGKKRTANNDFVVFL